MGDFTASVCSKIWILNQESIIVAFTDIIKAMVELQLGTRPEISTLAIVKMMCFTAKVY